MHRPLVHARTRRDTPTTPPGSWLTGARARATAATVVLAGLSATLVLTGDGGPTAAGPAPENAQTAPAGQVPAGQVPAGQVPAGGGGAPSGAGAGAGAAAVPVAPVPLTVPDVLEPGTTATVPVPDVPEGATGVLLDLTVTQVLQPGDPCDPASCPDGASASPRAGHASAVDVRLSGPDGDQVVLSAGAERVRVEAVPQGFVVGPVADASGPGVTPAGSLGVTTGGLFIIDCDIYLDGPAPAPDPSPGPPATADRRSLKVSGTVLRDAGGTGDVVDLRGTNLGGWLLQEGWMSPAGEAPLARTGWTASADATGSGDWPARALDGDPSTRWSSGREQTVGQTFTVDLGAARTFDEVSFDAGSSTGDVPPGFVVRASHDGRSWWDVGWGRGTGQKSTVHTDYQTARYVQVAITEADPARRWWSISEFHAYVSDEYNTRRVLTERFGTAVADSLVAGYQDAWLQESDLDVIRGVGMNMVRVPVDWQVLMRPDGTMRPDQDAFRRLDWLLAEAGERGIYVVLDLHGAPGAACPWHSCGQAGSNALWSDAVQQERTVRIWQRIAARYAGNPTVAAYDLLNEPLVTMGAGESAEQTRQKFDLYDRLYDAVRAVDPDHVVVVAAFYTWENALPPSSYGWTNVMYQTHHYRFSATGDHAAMQQFVDDELARLSQYRALWQVPVYAGEFHMGEFDDLYSRWLTGLNGIHAAWSTWTYKVRGGGHWGLFQDNAGPVPDLAADTPETIAATWARFATSGFVPNTRLQDVLRAAAAPRATPTVPSTIEAEGYVQAGGLQSEPSTGGGVNLGWTDPGDFVQYDVVAPAAGTYRVTLRVASPGGSPGALRVVSPASSSPVSVPATGGWQSWTDVTTTVRLGAGSQRIRLQVDGSGWNLDRLGIAPV
ncbi:cellulase family glycosylhydrolase [Cellulomonas sp. Marseille-Q8402]